MAEQDTQATGDLAACLYAAFLADADTQVGVYRTEAEAIEAVKTSSRECAFECGGEAVPEDTEKPADVRLWVRVERSDHDPDYTKVVTSLRPLGYSYSPPDCMGEYHIWRIAVPEWWDQEAADSGRTEASDGR